MLTKRIKIGEITVESGKILIMDPAYISTEWKSNTSENSSSDDISSDSVYRHKEDNSLWQYTGLNLDIPMKPIFSYINPFPGSYEDVIPKYNKSPADLIEEGLFIPVRVLPEAGNCSEIGCDQTIAANEIGGQLYYESGEPGAGVTVPVSSGSGTFDVYVIIDLVTSRIVRVIIELEDETEILLTQESVSMDFESHKPMINLETTKKEDYDTI